MTGGHHLGRQCCTQPEHAGSLSAAHPLSPTHPPSSSPFRSAAPTSANLSNRVSRPPRAAAQAALLAGAESVEMGSYRAEVAALVTADVIKLCGSAAGGWAGPTLCLSPPPLFLYEIIPRIQRL